MLLFNCEDVLDVARAHLRILESCIPNLHSLVGGLLVEVHVRLEIVLLDLLNRFYTVEIAIYNEILRVRSSSQKTPKKYLDAYSLGQRSRRAVTMQ